MPTTPFRTPASPAVGAALVLLLISPLTACGETYINADATATTAGSASTATTTLAPVASDASVDDLLSQMAGELSGLSEAILDKEDPDARLARINAIWVVLQPKLADDRASQDNVATIVDFANLAVDRRRPADADKAVKLLDDVINAR